MKTWIRRKLRGDWTAVMLATIQSRTLCLLVSCQKIKIRIHKIIILPMVHYGWETWSLTLRGELRPRVFENRVLRILRPRRDEVTWGWRKLHNEELHYFYTSPSAIRMIKSREWNGQGMWHEWGRGGMHVGYWWEKAWRKETTGKTKT
jgi:hypothetical protein